MIVLEDWGLNTLPSDEGGAGVFAQSGRGMRWSTTPRHTYTAEREGETITGDMRKGENFK